MGGKSSKNSKKKGGGGGGGAAQQQNGVVRSGHHQSNAKAAWEKPVKNGSRGGSNGRNSVVNRLKDANDTWGVTTYNLLDMGEGGGGGGGGRDDYGNRHVFIVLIPTQPMLLACI